MIEFPNNKEKPQAPRGRRGLEIQKGEEVHADIRVPSLHAWTNIIVKAWPKKTKLTNKPKASGWH